MNRIAAVNHCQDRAHRATWILMQLLCCAVLLLGSRVSAQENLRTKPREIHRGLPLPARPSTNLESESSSGKSVSATSGLLSTVVSLGLIVGTLLLVGRWLKRSGFHGAQSLPMEAFEVLGRRMLEPRNTVHLVKCGSRVLLLGVGADGIRTLAEINDPAEIEHLLNACQQPLKNERPAFRSDSTNSTTPAQSPSKFVQRIFMGLLTIGMCLATGAKAEAQETRSSYAKNRPRGQVEVAPAGRDRGVQPAAFEPSKSSAPESQSLVSPQQLGLSLKMLALMTVFSLAPSILMMTTCFVRFIVVLGLLRQALGTQQGPPNQVLTAICLFLTFLVMSPVWQRCYHEGIRPYTNPAAEEPSIDEATALSRTLAPVRGFMSQQIDKAGNADAIWMLLDFQRPSTESSASEGWREPQSYDEVPFTVLAPAYLLSELKVGFLIGFQLFLPFLVIDLVVAVVLTSLGLTMLPPSMVSLPFKLLLFVLIDGWFLTVGMLLESVKVA